MISFFFRIFLPLLICWVQRPRKINRKFQENGPALSKSFGFETLVFSKLINQSLGRIILWHIFFPHRRDRLRCIIYPGANGTAKEKKNIQRAWRMGACFLEGSYQLETTVADDRNAINNNLHSTYTLGPALKISEFSRDVHVHPTARPGTVRKARSHSIYVLRARKKIQR
jgi:hypothetical protein